MTSYFSSFSAFLYMGGYADYVWPAYALVVTLLVCNAVIAITRFRSQIKKLRNRDAS